MSVIAQISVEGLALVHYLRKKNRSYNSNRVSVVSVTLIIMCGFSKIGSAAIGN